MSSQQPSDKSQLLQPLGYPPSPTGRPASPFPPSASPLTMSFDHSRLGTSWDDEQSRARLLEPYLYLSSVPGKGIRERMILAFNRWLKVDKAQLKQIIEIVQMLHTASLMIDDIEDNSKKRRGVPCVHASYGMPATLNCANYVYFLALQKCTALKNTDAMDAFAEELIELHRGQGLDIMWRDSGYCPSEGEYQAMVLQKTGGLFRLAARMMQAFSSFKQDLRPLVNAIAFHFQVMDDYINLRSNKYMKNKAYCEDITEGKYSFPILYYINKTDDRIFKNILRARTEDKEMKRLAVRLLMQGGAFIYTKTVMEQLYESVKREIDRLGKNDDLLQLIAKVQQQVLDCEPFPNEEQYQDASSSASSSSQPAPSSSSSSSSSVAAAAAAAAPAGTSNTDAAPLAGAPPIRVVPNPQ